MSQVGETVSERVIQKVATESDTGVLELPPLHDAIEPDALDACVAGMADGEVSFTYQGRTVTVESDGTVRLDEGSPSGRVAEIAGSDD